MKTFLYLTTAAALSLFCTRALVAQHSAVAETQRPEPQSLLTVTFDGLRGFTDFRYDGQTKRRTAARFERVVVAALTPLLEAHGDVRLELTFRDINLAGSERLFLRSHPEPIRVIEEHTPPSAQITYRLLDASGTVLAEGSERLLDRGFRLHGGRRLSGEAFGYELNMLQDWLKKALAIDSETLRTDPKP